jgi:hypothetical protein
VGGSTRLRCDPTATGSVDVGRRDPSHKPNAVHTATAEASSAGLADHRKRIGGFWRLSQHGVSPSGWRVVASLAAGARVDTADVAADDETTEPGSHFADGASSLGMVADRWSGSRSFLLAAARLRGLHLDSLRRGTAKVQLRGSLEPWLEPVAVTAAAAAGR